MESFYGGRAGTPFIIVKRYDCIDAMPKNAEGVSVQQYHSKVCAVKKVDDKNYFIVQDNGSFIEKNKDNQGLYTWAVLSFDGSTVDTVDTGDNYGEFQVEEKPKTGMLQDFQQGISTLNEVNYGEYVIIDSQDKKDKDNGKVFRRGFNYNQVDAVAPNENYGGEYIGQICGPEGSTPTVEFVGYNDIDSYTGVREGSYQASADLTPGYKDGEFNDNISYKYANLADGDGNIYGCVIGLKIPYTITDLSLSLVDQKDDEGNVVHPQLKDDNDTDIHPFYHDYKVTIPKSLSFDTKVNEEDKAPILRINEYSQEGPVPYDVKMYVEQDPDISGVQYLKMTVNKDNEPTNIEGISIGELKASYGLHIAKSLVIDENYNPSVTPAELEAITLLDGQKGWGVLVAYNDNSYVYFYDYKQNKWNPGYTIISANSYQVLTNQDLNYHTRLINEGFLFHLTQSPCIYDNI